MENTARKQSMSDDDESMDRAITTPCVESTIYIASPGSTYDHFDGGDSNIKGLNSGLQRNARRMNSFNNRHALNSLAGKLAGKKFDKIETIVERKESLNKDLLVDLHDSPE